MSKRSLSPNPLPPAKRIHTTGPHLPAKSPFSFNDSLYDELILCIFSHLSWFDLCAAQATSTNWCRLACDNTLWKNLYLRVFGRSRLRGSRGYVIRADGREVRPLPGRIHIKQEPIKDWKWMFRVSSNWKNGRCAIEELETDCGSLSPSPSETHVLLAGPLTIVASSLPSDVPKVNISTSAANTFGLACESRSNGGPYHISTLAIDQSPPLHGHSRLAVFLSSGEFTIFSINPSQLSASVRNLTFLPSRGRSRVNSVHHAAYHHPLLVTLSTNFTLSLYDLSGDSVVLTQTLTSFTSFPPSSMVLSTTSSTRYKLILAYTIPVYPEHWSVGVTELIISGSKSPAAALTSMLSDTLQWSLEPVRVVSTRTTRAIDTPLGFFDDEKLRSLHEQYSRKVSCVTGTQTDGKWVVLAPAEATPAGVSSGSSFTSVSSSINTPDTPDTEAAIR
ncbi:hypothetical protein H0H92_009947 [Tricholoma furcatifolium]|nr:hypothetical protein H0H92_009947 [Tricholoma furcatifolium]